MAIKFGDLIENINADQAVIDLLSNNAKGLLFVSDFSDTSGSGGGVQAIPESKRGGKGAMVLDQTTGNLYAYLGNSGSLLLRRFKLAKLPHQVTGTIQLQRPLIGFRSVRFL